MTESILTRRSIRFAAPLARDRSGASAIEFALIAPMICAGLLSVVDVGRAVNERLMLEGVLRAGALMAMSDPGVAAVSQTIGFVDSGQGAAAQRGGLTLDVERYCACLDETETPLACNAPCAGSSQTAIFYRLAGSTTYEGMFLPRISLGAESRVRIR